MHERKAFGRLTAISIFAVVGLGASSAGAVGDIMSLPTYACQWIKGGTPQFAWAGLYNGGTGEMTVECGVPNNEDVQSATDWSVMIEDLNGTKNAKCSLTIMDTWGTTVATGAQQNTVGTGNQGLYWDWHILSPSQLGAVTGVAQIHCTIPAIQGTAKSGLNGLYVKRQF